MINTFETLSWIISAIAVPFAFFMLKQVEASKEDRHKLKEEIANVRLEMAKNYVQKNSLSALEQKIERDLEKVSDKLERLTDLLTKTKGQ